MTQKLQNSTARRSLQAPDERSMHRSGCRTVSSSGGVGVGTHPDGTSDRGGSGESASGGGGGGSGVSERSSIRGAEGSSSSQGSEGNKQTAGGVGGDWGGGGGGGDGSRLDDRSRLDAMQDSSRSLNSNSAREVLGQQLPSMSQQLQEIRSIVSVLDRRYMPSLSFLVRR